MKKKSTSVNTTENTYHVSGTVSNQQQQPVPKVTVKAYSKNIRGKHLLGNAITDDSGKYNISYTPKKVAAIAVMVCVYDSNNILLKESAVQYNVPVLLQVDVDVSDKLIAVISMYEQLLNTVAPFTEEVPLAELTETDKDHDISFIAQKTGLRQDTIESLAMSARFETLSSITGQLWYGILVKALPVAARILPAGFTNPIDFIGKFNTYLDVLMHTPADILMNGIQEAIDENIIAHFTAAELQKIRKQLNAQVLAYAKKHPVTGASSILHQKAELGGLKGKELQSFIEAHINHTGTDENFWKQAKDHPELKNSTGLKKTEAVFHLSRLMDHDLSLIEKLIRSGKIKSWSDIKKLAAYDISDWEALVNEDVTKPAAATSRKSKDAKTKKYAAQLETAFTREFPTAAFAARLAKDKKSKLPHGEKINKFLQEHEHFDLLHTRIGQFLKENKHKVDKKDVPELEHHLRRTQRVFKLAPAYEAAHTLLSNNIHSAHQVATIGKDNFVKSYGNALGEKEAAQVFEKASKINATSVALLGNLKSMADASPMNAFPNFAQGISQTLIQELPSLESLFGHTDFFATDESRSVYGAPAYLTDILHFLDKRHSTLSPIITKTPSVKDLLLKRRPDIADIDLECNNTNTEVPYIDIACELMEDFIAAPVSVMFSILLLPKLVKGIIDSSLLVNIKGAFSSSGQSGFGNLLTAAATVSDKFTDNVLNIDNTTYITLDHWIIRDSLITIKVTNLGNNLQCRALHQTLLPADAISAAPQYVNTRAYDNFLKTAKRPFSLPFDLFNTEAELHLEKMGTKKADLIDIFSRAGQSPLHSTADINMGYASLGINQAEQTLIFQPDTANQSLYWGTNSTSTSITVNVFEKLTSLNYAQVDNLLKLQFINPTKDSVIEHDILAADTTKQRVTNITAAKLDAIHRFLRLWRKTSLTMNELDAFIVNMSVLNGLNTPTLNATLADQLRHFLLLQQSLQLSTFQLLSFYGDLDTSHNLPSCQYNQVYQNSTITNPVYPNFSIAAIQSAAVVLSDSDKLVICSIVQISLTELNAILTQTNTATLVTVRTLSIIYKHVQLAHSLDVSLSDLLTVLSLIGPNPFADPANTSQFITRVKLMLSFGFSIDDLNYILRHQNNADQTVIPTTDQRSTALNQLQNDLLNIKTATTAAVDTNGTLLTKWLSDAILKWDTSLVARLTDILGTVDDDAYKQKIVDNANFLLNLRVACNDTTIKADLSALPLASGVAITIPISLAAQLSFDADKKQLVLKAVISTADRDALLALSTDASYQAAINSLYSKSSITSNATGNIFFTSLSDVGAQLNNLLFANIADRFAYFINKVSPVYRKLLQMDALAKNIGTWFNINKTLGNILLTNVPEVFNDFTTDNFINKIIDTTVAGNPYPVQATRYHSVAKLFFVFRKLNLSALAQGDALTLFLTKGITMGCLDFRNLPLTAVSGSVSTFPGFEAILNLVRFDQLYPTRVIPFTAGGAGSYNIFGILIQTAGLPNDIPSALTQMKNNLAFAYGWNATDLQTLLASNFTVLADFTAAPAIMLRLHRSFTVLQQLGISLADAQGWCAVSLTSADSTKIKNVLRRKYNTNDWPQISEPLQDHLREKKRDALIAYLLTNPGTQTWKDENDLYSYFLLDVEMCSCQPTSRIVQATNSVQLFVQRCMLGLEQFISVDAKQDADWNQWQWRKNFRVWQANVKVFLYPENWIEPELLPKQIKSPFLKELEDELLQNEVTADSVETGFQNYLDKVNSVARLEVKGMWYDDPTKTLHVFGRTYGGDPKIYYYRKFIEGRRWTPWIKVDLDINSEHIIPVVYNNHVYLFWAIIKQHPDNAANWQIQLAYSEYKNGKWTPKKISENNDTGQITCAKTLCPDITKFFFTPIDIPIFDYTTIINTGDSAFALTTHTPAVAAYLQTVKKAVLQNGSLIISCFCSTFHPFVNGGQFAHVSYDYFDSFQLDIEKGYPVKVHVPNGFNVGVTDRFLFSLGRFFLSQFVNMFEAGPIFGLFTVPNSSIVLPTQARGLYNILIPFQMGFQDRTSFILDLLLTPAGAPAQIFTSYLLPYFYQDNHRTYFVTPGYTNNAAFKYQYQDQVKLMLNYLDSNSGYYTPVIQQLQATGVTRKNHYENFFHPQSGYFLQRLFINGIDGLMERDTQLKGDAIYDTSTNKFSFSTYYGDLLVPVSEIQTDANQPVEDVDFSLQSGYGLYNWELFFHAPLMIAERLSQNQKFDDADRWYKYIFNPMDMSPNPSPDKYWNTKPFFINVNNKYTQQRIDNILNGINSGTQPDLIQDVTDWRNNPFQPHLIAEYRTVAYQKVAVMKYIGHLVRHGDFLFRQHTTESVNEATQLYIVAAEILGPKPELIPAVGKTGVDNYYQLESKMDELSNAMVNIENLLPQHTITGYTGTTASTQGLPVLQTLYFNIPMNENLIGPTGYWDVVADRLFKIRHCMDIDGTVAPLSLFSPAIDPGLLVRAAAAGLDIGSILNDMNTPLPQYRFMGMVQKAIELGNEVKSLGSLMLSVLEKKDAEAMALLRSGHEIKILGATLLLKQKQINDAQSMLDNLNKQRELINVRQIYYLGLINEGLSGGEIAALGLNGASAAIDIGIALSYLFAAGAAAAPTITAGALAGPTGGAIGLTSDGGLNASSSGDSLARNLGAIATGLDKTAALINTKAVYDRRTDEWQFQVDLASKELEQVQKQIESAQIRLEIATQDFSNQQLMIDQAKEADDFMHNKFTNEELFNWMITQVSTTYFRSYQLAYDIAKQTERCFRYELGLADSAYINFGYWDSLKKGLLAGEQLSYDIRKMEKAYYEQNKRELELTKPISLSQLDPVALLKLKTTGECWINLPEELFDMDYPGHYMRRIKSVSITIPCISGPYTTVSCKLTMTRNSVRASGIAGDATQYPRKQVNGIPGDDPRFRDGVGALQSIATSSAQNDSGLFELNFRDERYLPFEGAGTVSLWHLQLPAAIRQFDYDSISDVIIHLKYTARDGGEALGANAATSLSTRINQMLVSTKDKGLMRIFSAKNDLPTEWYRFLHPLNTTDDQVLTLDLNKSRFPLFVQGKTIKIRSVELVADSTLSSINNIQISPVSGTDVLNLTATGVYGSCLSASVDYSNSKKDPGTWLIKNPAANNHQLTNSELKNLVIIVQYEVS